MLATVLYLDMLNASVSVRNVDVALNFEPGEPGVAVSPSRIFNTGDLVGGTTIDFDSGGTRGEAFGKVNLVAQVAVMEDDIRAISPEQVERTITKMKEIGAEISPGSPRG